MLGTEVALTHIYCGAVAEGAPFEQHPEVQHVAQVGRTAAEEQQAEVGARPVQGVPAEELPHVGRAVEPLEQGQQEVAAS